MSYQTLDDALLSFHIFLFQFFHFHFHFLEKHNKFEKISFEALTMT